MVATQLLPPGLKASLRQLAMTHETQRPDAAARLERARRMIEGGRSLGDPRTLGYAEALLAPWPDPDTAPPDILVLRATIEQARHQFAQARKTLDRVLARDAGHPQALLTRATVATVTGDYAAARRDCGALRFQAPDAAAICLAGVDALTGEQARALQTLRIATARTQGALRAWALATAAQVFEQRGEVDAALDAYRASLGIEEDVVTRVACASLLASQGRHAEARRELLRAPPGDAVLLQRWQIAKALGERGDEFRDPLRERFARAAERGEWMHAREAAQFALADGRTSEAARLAQRNWAMQREPADLLILCNAGQAVDDRAMIREAIRWTNKTGLRDARLPDICQEKQT